MALLSAVGADPARFRAVFEPLFNQLEDIGISFAALELGNEINWTAFNGDFPIPGEGRVFGLEDLTRDPEARKIAVGYRAYLQTLSGAERHPRSFAAQPRDADPLRRPLRSRSSPARGPARKPMLSRSARPFEYLRANGIDALVDAYGVHTYPWAKTAARRLDQLEQDTLAECRPRGARQTMLAHRVGAARRPAPRARE